MNETDEMEVMTAGAGGKPMDLDSGEAFGALPGQAAIAALPEPELADTSAMLMDLPVVLKVVLGSARMALASVAKLGKNSVVRLDKKVGDPVEILVNGRLIAKGDVVILDQEENRFGIVLTEIVGAVAKRNAR